jgi:vacuolar protein sorting-associated protein 54
MSGLPHQSDREKARKEAQECLDAMRQEGFQLDGFNLLGVVADPRSGMMSPSHLMQGTRSSFQHDAAGESEDANNSSDIFSDAFQSLTEQMNSVTEQIDTFNMFLEELSKEYLGDDSGESLLLEYYYQDEEALEVEDRLELSNVSLDTINAYLEECGDLAHDLFTKGLETRTRTDSHQKEAGDGEKNCLEEIPQVFCEDSFDLFHSKTFVQLLLEGEEDDVKKSKETNSLYQPTQKLVLLKEPDSLARYLDRIELALQEQVRQKAGAFFQETTRFRQLQSSISDLLEQVLTLRKYVNSISSVMKQTNDISSHQRQNYEEFVDLMDSALDLIRCKGSIGGLLSANDHLGAAQQIQYGRKLLQGQFDQLSALSTCGEQFRQYQSLVTQSLSEELVDAFFHWKKENDTERVKEVVEALNLCQAMSNTGEVYTRRLQQTIRMTVRTTIAEFVESSSSNGKGGSGVTGMSYEAFYDCLQLLMEELLTVLNTAQNVDVFCVAEDIFSEGQSRWTNETVITGADLAAKSIAELLRLRKEAHSLINLDSMKQLWDTCMQFTTSVEESFSEDNKIIKAVGLRSTLVGQAKAFLDRTHESNMSVLVAALDSERWTQCEVRFRVLRHIFWSGNK